MIDFQFNILPSIRNPVAAEDESILTQIFGALTLTLNGEALYQSSRTMILMAIIELCNAITRTCVENIDTRLTIMMEPIIDMKPHLEGVGFYDAGDDVPIAVEGRGYLIGVRDDILKQLRVSSPDLIEIVERRLLTRAA